MRGLVLIAVAVGAAVLTCASASAEKPAPWTIGPITASFVQSEFATHYTVSIKAGSLKKGKLEVDWSLAVSGKSAEVDPACSFAAGFQNTDKTKPNYECAGLDPGCNNDDVGTGLEPEHMLVTIGQPSQFVWHHPDQASDPNGPYNCDHTKQGPHGHQGLITVTVSNGDLRCSATYKGTETSTSTSTTDGTASAVKCVDLVSERQNLPRVVALLKHADTLLAAEQAKAKSSRLPRDEAIHDDVNVQLALIEAASALPDVGDLPVGKVVLGLYHADHALDGLAIERNAESKPLGSNPNPDQVTARFSLEDLATATAKTDPEVSAGFSDLAKTVKDLDPWKMTADAFDKEIKKLEQRKHNLAARLPHAYGMTFARLDDLWTGTWNALGSVIHAGDNPGAALAHTITAKEKLEAALKAAS